MNGIIETTPDYDLTVGKVDDVDVYIIRNRQYGVVETSTALLPQAYEYLSQIQAALDVRRSELEVESVEAGTDGVLKD